MGEPLRAELVEVEARLHASSSVVVSLGSEVENGLEQGVQEDQARTELSTLSQQRMPLIEEVYLMTHRLLVAEVEEANRRAHAAHQGAENVQSRAEAAESRARI